MRFEGLTTFMADGSEERLGQWWGSAGGGRFEEFAIWASTDGIEIVMIATGAVLVARFARWLADQFIAGAERKEEDERDAGLVPSETSKHERALAQVVAWSAIFLVYIVAVLMILERLNLPLTSLVAPATLIGAGLGFGSQRIVQDLLSGIFIFAERQYGFGDVVQIAPPGDPAGISGTVEELTLRTTKLRTLDGMLIIIPNGEIRQVTNLSKDWARVVLDIPLPADADLSRATELLRGIGTDLAADDKWAVLLLDEPTVMGIEKMTVGLVHMRFVARTLPGKQWEVGRELRRRVADAFRTEGIVVPTSFLATPSPAP